MAQSPLSTCYSGYSNQINLKSAAQKPRSSCFGANLPISHEELLNQPASKIELKTKPRGELAELAFMRKAASLGFAVAKPWGDCDRYDVIVRSGRTLWRVQVKSVAALNPYRHHYRIGVVDRWRFPYTADQIDFLVGYVFPEDAWYIFPVAVTESHKIVCVRPGLKGAKYEEYREAWELMRTGPTKSSPTV